MNAPSSVKRDERTVAVENASYKWSFIFLIFTLFIDVIYRGLIRQEAAWDLLALVIVGSAIGTVYQVRQKALPYNRAWPFIFILSLGSIIGAIVVLIMLWFIN